MSTRYAHTNIIAGDWRSLAQFYEEVFECLPIPPERDQSGQWLEKGTGVKDAALKGIHLRLPGFGEDGPTLEIYSYSHMEQKSPPVPNRQGLGHLAFTVDDVEKTLQKVLENGGTSLGEIVTKVIPNTGTITFVYAVDPEGNIIEIQQWTL
ncbi:MAG: VOC family protein [bacterium]|nr:VOC family protein [bacterium]